MGCSSEWVSGGLMGRSEEPAETAAREVSEEVGLDIDLGDALPVAIRTPDRRHFNFIFRIDFETVGGEAPAPQSPEISGVDWFSPDQLPELAEHVDLLLAAVGLLPPSRP